MSSHPPRGGTERGPQSLVIWPGLCGYRRSLSTFSRRQRVVDVCRKLPEGFVKSEVVFEVCEKLSDLSGISTGPNVHEPEYILDKDFYGCSTGHSRDRHVQIGDQKCLAVIAYTRIW